MYLGRRRQLRHNKSKFEDSCFLQLSLGTAGHIHKGHANRL